MAHITTRGNLSPLHLKSKRFAVDVVIMVKQNNDWRLNSLFQQLIRSATSVHANIRESEFAQSPADFVSKLSISRKEANESHGWLEILHDSGCIDDTCFERLFALCDELLSMLTASIKTTKLNYNLKD